jgi:hypothetical protein
MGLLMGLTAVAFIHSPWGKQSGAHFNPAVTLTFLRLGKVMPGDAVFLYCDPIRRRGERPSALSANTRQSPRRSRVNLGSEARLYLMGLNA